MAETEYFKLDQEYFDKNCYHWALEKACATVHAFKEFGSYQGDWYAKVSYEGKDGWSQGSYGSCSGCDSFQAELSSDYDENYSDLGYRKESVIKFGKEYLEEIVSKEDALKEAKRNIEWDMDAENIVKFMEDNEDAS